MMFGVVAVVVMMLQYVAAADTTFTPGCSFIGGQCMYTVQLGHEGQCDQVKRQETTTTVNTARCCDDFEYDIRTMKATVERHTQEIENITKALAKSQNELESESLRANQTESERDQLLEMLRRKEEELNNTQTDMANILHKANQEIQSLRADLTNVTQALSNCHAALGVAATDTGVPASLAGDVNLFYCKFDSANDCGFNHLTGGTDFTLMSRGSSSSSGPKVDHSSGVPEGRYLGINTYNLAQTSLSTTTKTATIESPSFEPANGYCIYFWYSMRGKDVQKLDVNVRIGGGTGYPVWTRSGDQTEPWLLGQVELDSEYTANQFKLDFVATTDAHKSYSTSVRDYIYYGQYGDIGVDDLYVYNTSCSDIPKCPANAHVNTLGNVTSCYTFHTAALTWDDAYDTCRREGPWSGLVSIETQEEQDYLVSLIKADTALSLVGANGFYTSGSDKSSEHNFVWTDTGSERSIDNFAWHTGQPNNVGGDQDCLLMEYDNDDYRWGDVACSTTHPFICEVYF